MKSVIRSIEKYQTFVLHLLLFLFIMLSHFLYLEDMTIYVNQWDPVTRIRMAVNSSESDSLLTYLLPSTAWLPLHFYIIRFVYLIAPGISPIIFLYINMVLAALAFNCILHLVSKNISSNKKIYLTLFLALASLNHITFFFSKTGLSEPIGFFIILIACVFYDKYKFHRSLFYLCLLVFSLVLMTMIRYELWLICAVFYLALLYIDRLSFRNILVVIVISIFPIIFMYYSNLKSGTPLIGFELIVKDAVNVGQSLSSVFETYNHCFFYALNFFIACFPLLPLIKKNTYNNLYSWLFLTAFVFVFVFVTFEKLEPDPRYTYFSVGLFILAFANLISKRKFYKFDIVYLILFSLLSSYAFYNTSKRSVYDFTTLRKADDLEESIIKIADIINRDPVVKNKIFTIRELLIPELIAMRLKMLTKNRERLIFTVNDIHENMTPENSWKFYRSNDFFSHPNLYYLIIPKVSDTPGDPGHIDRWEDSRHYDRYTKVFESKSLALFKRKVRTKNEN